MHSLFQNQRAIFAILAAMALFVSNDAAMKSAGASLPLTETLFFRGFFAAILTFAVITARGELAQIPRMLHKLVFLRGFLEIAGSFAFQGGLLLMPIGDVTAIVQVVPLLLLGFAAVFLREKISTGRILAVAIGFAGAVLVAAPSGAISFGAWLAFLTALVVVARDLLARHIGQSISPLVVTLATNLMVPAAALLIMPLDHSWKLPAAATLAMLFAAGLCLAAAYVAMTYALIWAQVQTLTPFYYSQTLFAVFYSLLLFGDRPSLQVIAGTAMILAAGLYTAVSGGRTPALAAAVDL